MGLSTSAASSRPAAEAFENRIEWSIVPGRPNPTVLALVSPLPLVSARFGTHDYTHHLETMLRVRDFDVVILDQYAMVWAISISREAKGMAQVRSLRTSPIILRQSSQQIQRGTSMVTHFARPLCMRTRGRQGKRSATLPAP